MPEADALPIAVRVFTTRKRRRDELQESLKPSTVKRRYPQEALVFDTETATDPAQQLLVGSWRMYRDSWDGAAGTTCIEEGLFYPDDLPISHPDFFAAMEAFAASTEAALAEGFSRVDEGRRIMLKPLSWWLDHRLHTYGYEHRNRCEVVGFNLLFDLGRLAGHWGKARGYFRGGFSLRLWGKRGKDGVWRDRRYHPRLLVKSIDPRRTLFAWGALKKGDEDYKGTNGRFVDLRTLAFALRDESLTLETACTAFDVPFAKRPVRYGVVDEEMLHYLREDVEATTNLYRACKAELAKHEGILLPAHRLYSPATVGAAYLDAMGLQHPMEKFDDLDPRIHGWAMSAFFGGRAEARIVRTEVPVAYVDATSMYPTVNALLGTWRILAADRVRPVDVTKKVRSLLGAPDLVKKCLQRSFWNDDIGVTLVQIENPVDQILPVRAHWDPDGADPGIGVNPLTYDGRLWYMLPDVIASVILGGKPPTVRKAIRLRGVGRQQGLQSVLLRGHRELDPNSRHTDPFVAMIEERQRLRRDMTLTDAERARLDRFLKITANSTSYGILARFDRRDLAKNAKIVVYGPDDEPSTAETRHPEDAGPFAFPPIAASLTSAARLMLALLEHLVTEAGGAYAFCDTDSMGIVTAPSSRRVPCVTEKGQSIRALSRSQVRRVLARFEDLNPYDHELVPALWKQEFESLDHPLTCYAISAKRYALLRDGDLLEVVDVSAEFDGDESAGPLDEGVLVDRSEHGLGLYLDPTEPEQSQRDDQGRRLWISQSWEWILGRRAHLPNWSKEFALTRFTVSTARVSDWFRRFNQERTADGRVRPGSFGLLAHPSPMFRGLSDHVLPAAPYDRDPGHWAALPWYDRRSGERVTVAALEMVRADPEALHPGLVIVDSLAEVVLRYRDRPEHKSMSPDGTPAGGDTAGRLLRRPLLSAPVLTNLTGKEGNRLLERLTGEIEDESEYRNDYGGLGDRWTMLIRPILREMGSVEASRRSGRSRRAIERAIRENSPTRPRTSSMDRYLTAASDWVVTERGSVQRNSLGQLYVYWRSRGVDT